MCAALVSWLRFDGWRVYAEVNSIDLIATKDNVVWAIEAKLRFGLEVLAQASRLRSKTNRASIAIPPPRRRDDTFSFGCSVAREFGLGLLTVSRPEWSCVGGRQYPYVIESIEPVHREHHDPKLTRLLILEATPSENVAGRPGGPSMTPFRLTVLKLKAWVRDNAGRPLRDAVAEIQHHYGSAASARSTLRKRIRQGLIPGVDFRLGRLYPTKACPVVNRPRRVAL